MRAKWALAPGGRVAHRWRYIMASADCWSAARKLRDHVLDWELRPPGKAPRCKRCAKGVKR